MRSIVIQNDPPAWRPTALGAIFAAMSLVLLTSILWLPQPGAMGLGVALASACLLAAAAVRLSTRGVRASWRVPAQVHAGEEVDIQVEASSPVGAPPVALLHRDPLTGKWLTTARLGPGGGPALRHLVSMRFPRRGDQILPGLRAAGELPFALVRSARTVCADAHVLVLPGIGRVPRHLDLQLLSWSDACGPSTLAGDDEVERLRQWQPGDPPRTVHWPSSARAGRLLVIERRTTAARRAAIIVDLGGAGEAGQNRFEKLLSAAATVITHLHKAGWTLSLHLPAGPDGRPWRIDGGHHRMLEALAMAVPSPADPRAVLPRDQPVIILSRRAVDTSDLRPAPMLIGPTDLDRMAAGGRG